MFFLITDKQQKHINKQNGIEGKSMLISSKPIKIIETDSGKIYIYPPRVAPSKKETEEYCRRIIECLLSAQKSSKIKG